MRRSCFYAVVVSIALGGSATGQTPRTAPSSIRSVRLDATTQPGTATVLVESTGGPLPEPESGAPVNPPRIYLDFVEVRATSVVQPESDPIVSRIRIAEHTASPLVTRVVVDLNKPMPYRVDASARAQGRVLLIIGGTQTRTPAPINRPPAPRATPSQTAGPSASVPAQPPAAPPASRGRGEPPVAQYDTRVAAALVRIHALKPLLEAIDRRVDTLSGDLGAAAKEFDDIAKLLGALKPPPSRATVHALLLRSCTLGARAIRLRQTASAGAGQDANATWDAASAAAGALLMLEKANAELAGK